MENHSQLINSLGSLAVSAMDYAKKAHDSVFKDRDIGAIAYLSLAGSKIAIFQAIYISNHDVLERFEIDKFLHQYEVFAEEMAKNYATDHSQQWTDIEFNRLKEAFELLPFP